MDAYLQVYKNNTNVLNTIHHYHKHYPFGYLYLCSDGGDYFDEYQCKYTKVYHDPINIGLGRMRWTDIQIVYERLQRAVSYFESKFFLFLEDDVLIREPIDIKKLGNGDMFGIKQNEVRPFISERLKTFGINCPADFRVGGAGGTIFRTDAVKRWDKNLMEKFFLPIYNNWDNVDAWSRHQLSHIDYILSIVCLLHGQTYQNLPCLSNLDGLNHSSIVHGVKDWSIVH